MTIEEIKKQNRLGRFLKGIALLCIADLLLAAVFFVCSEQVVGKGDFHKPADAGVLFFGGFDAEGDLNAESLRRVAHARKLAEESSIAKVLCVGGYRPERKESGARIMCDKLASAIGRHKVLVDENSYDTETNLESAYRLAEREGWTRLALISSPSHVLRISSQQAFKGETVNAPYPAGVSFLFTHPVTVWGSAHHEWAAYVAKWILGNELYRRTVRNIRGQ